MTLCRRQRTRMKPVSSAALPLYYPASEEEMMPMIEPKERLQRPALVVVDMQNDFVRVGAPLEVPDARATIGAHQALLAAFRSRGLPIVYTKFLSQQEPSLLWEWSPQCRPDTKCCWKGHKRYYADVGKTLE